MYALYLLQMILFMQRDSSLFPKFDFKPTHMPGFEPSDEFLYQITVPFSTESEPKSDDTCPWSKELSNELLYEVAAKLFDEEHKAKIDTSELPANYLNPLNIECTIKKVLNEKLALIITETFCT